MIYQLIIKDKAKLDFENITKFYEKKREDLGFEFWNAVELAFQDILSNPLGYQIKYDVYRTKLVKPFPYLLIFELLGKDIVVYQCFGGKDDPIKKHKNK